MEERVELVKKGFNIYLYYWTIPVVILFVLINYFARDFKIAALNIELMISIVSFLFGFLISISFSMLIGKNSAVKDALATEAGRLVSLYLLSKDLGKGFHEKIKERIDDYTVKTLREYTNYNISRESIYGMYQDIRGMEIKNEYQKASADSFLYLLGEFEPLREKLEYLTSRKIEWSLKFTNYLLGAILISLLFLNRGDWFTNILFVVLSSTIIFILLIIEDYDSLRIGDYIYNISNSEQIFDLIGKERYYPREILRKVKLHNGRTYRIGFLNEKTGEEKVFNIVYKNSSKIKLGILVKRLKRDKKIN
ncbi:MAG: hypothetical protein WC781_03110 [Candidatus Pacearchaeota archaeon]